MTPQSIQEAANKEYLVHEAKCGSHFRPKGCQEHSEWDFTQAFRKGAMLRINENPLVKVLEKIIDMYPNNEQMVTIAHNDIRQLCVDTLASITVHPENPFYPFNSELQEIDFKNNHTEVVTTLLLNYNGSGKFGHPKMQEIADILLAVRKGKEDKE